MIAYNLLRPFSYLTIKYPHKWKFDWAIPCSLALITAAILGVLRLHNNIAIFSGDSLTGKILGFIQGLPGFYIAALAAIATFNRLDIDRLMPSPSPQLGLNIRGNKVIISLTRRRFLCSLFAFLTAESILLVIVSIFSQSLSNPIRALVKESHRVMCVDIFLFFYMLLFWQMITTSFLGLFYLGDKLHQPDEDSQSPIK